MMNQKTLKNRYKYLRETMGRFGAAALALVLWLRFGDEEEEMIELVEEVLTPKQDTHLIVAGQMASVRSRMYYVQWNGASSAKHLEPYANDLSRECIQKFWDEGALPVQVGKQWVVGYLTHKSFFMTTTWPIKVGPHKPSHFRDRYSNVVILD